MSGATNATTRARKKALMLHDHLRHRASERKCGTADDRKIATPIRAELIGDDQATALGIEAKSAAPVLDLCRKLVATGHDAVSALHAYRGATLSLIVCSIGKAAALDVIDGRFQKWRPRKPSAASPIVRTAPPPPRVPPVASDALGGPRRAAGRAKR
jgi:hypothetical protein